MKNKPEIVDDYIKRFPVDVQAILKRMRRTIRKAAPRAVELISYGIPSYKIDGKVIVSFAAWKHHIGVYPLAAGSAAFRRRAAPYKAARSTLQFPLKKPIPYVLLAELVRWRIREARASK